MADYKRPSEQAPGNGPPMGTMSDSKMPPPQFQQHAPQPGPPAPSYDTPRILHIYLDGITHRHMTITDMDKSTPLYHIDQNSGGIFSSKPHMTITAPQAGNALVGTATFHNSFNRTVDMTFRGNSIPVSLESDGFFTRAHSFHCPSFGERLIWQCEGIFGADLVLVNERKEWIARFDASLFSIGKNGKIQVVNGAIQGDALNDIVVSGCAMVQYERRRRRNNSGGGGGA